MRELYALIVGEAGVSPQYFLSMMTPDEAADFLEGYRRRQREAWERARIGWFMQVSDAEGKEMTDIFPFEWDKKKRTKRVSKRQLDKLRSRAAAIAETLKRHGEK